MVEFALFIAALAFLTVFPCYLIQPDMFDGTFLDTGLARQLKNALGIAGSIAIGGWLVATTNFTDRDPGTPVLFTVGVILFLGGVASLGQAIFTAVPKRED